KAGSSTAGGDGSRTQASGPPTSRASASAFLVCMASGPYCNGSVSHLPISHYGLLSDCRSAALVSRAGSVDWLCFPRFDQPSVFARILDERAGHWSIKPVGDFTA